MMPQDPEETFTLRQFLKGVAVFMVFWGVVVAAAMATFFPESFSQAPVVLEGNQK